MSIETTVLAGLSQFVDVKQVQRLIEGKSFEFIPHGYPLDNEYGAVSGRGSFVMRAQQARVLKLSLRSGTICETINIDGLRREFDARNALAMFGAIRLRERVSEGQAIFTVYVEHSIGLRAVNDAHIAEVMSDMVRLYTTAIKLVADEVINEHMMQLKNARQQNRELNDRPAIPKPNSELDKVLAELNALVGLSEVKSFVEGLVAQFKVAAMRAQHGLPVVPVSPHLVFTGNPGTGKTTVARLIGRIYKELGLLEKGHVVEADRSSLVGVYLGQTASKTKEMCEQALGGVLFIDEAYSLNVIGRDYGSEAIETLLTFMEQHRGNFVVVAAGYPCQMHDFVNSNPGLHSRFDLTIPFADYNASDMMQIFTNLLTENQYVLSASAALDMKAYFIDLAATDCNGNARDVRKVFQEVLAGHAQTLVTLKNPTLQQLQTITSASLPSCVTSNVQIALEDLPPV